MSRKILANGINYSTGKLLLPPMDKTLFAKKIKQSLFRRDEEVHYLTGASMKARIFKSVIKHKIIDLGDPRSSGWTFLVNKNDPNKAEIIKTLKPLAEHRGMKDPESPLIFNDEPEYQWQNWLQDNYHSIVLRGKKAPHYVLIVGGPDRVPFKFQSLFDCAASVGRVAFDSLKDLKSYVDKIIRIEQSDKFSLNKEAIIFATDEGIQDPTYFSCKFMAEPLAIYLKNNLEINVKTLLRTKATKENLLTALKENRPALVYTASHGLGDPEKSLGEQKEINGAICCQETGGYSQDCIFTAKDVPDNQEPFLEGAIFFQFACFGYGTPADSDYAHWLEDPNIPKIYSNEDFVAALPKKLLAHPKGPVAYVGHLDIALLDGFDDPNPDPFATSWHSRMAPFVYAVKTLLGDYNPVGTAMDDMNKRYNVCNSLLTSALDELKQHQVKGRPINEEEFFGQIADTFIFRTDAQNYMVFGDPAARPLIKMQ